MKISNRNADDVFGQINSSETKFLSPNDSEILSSINNLVFRFISVYYPKLTPTHISFSL
jgi:hypothetical protein